MKLSSLKEFPRFADYLEELEEYRSENDDTFLRPVFFLRMKSEFKFRNASELSLSILRDTEKIIRFTPAFHTFLDSAPLEEVGRHITTNHRITRRSTIIVDSRIIPIGKNACCVEESVFFCNQKTSSRV